MFGVGNILTTNAQQNLWKDTKRWVSTLPSTNQNTVSVKP